MSDHGSGPHRVTKRCLLACARCRGMKVRCSGTFPCTRCERSKKQKQCRFEDDSGRTSLPGSDVRESDAQSIVSSMRENANDLMTDSSTIMTPRVEQPRKSGSVESQRNDFVIRNSSLSDAIPTPPANDATRSDFSRNPLVDTEFALAPDGKYWFMGPSSSWAFCRRVLALIGRQIPEANNSPDPWNLDGMAFQLKWTPLGRDEVPDVSDIPPLDYALFLLNSAKYCLGPLFQIIDEQWYHRHLDKFYEDPLATVSSSRLWYAQHLLLLAFGKAFIHCGSPSSLAGSHYASRAMSLLPDLSGRGPAPLRAIEVLCLAALYFQCVDMRLAAFQHIGQALRLCIIEGIHRHMPQEVVGSELSHRCNYIFWTVYVLDRQFSALMGAPSSIRDQDITTKLPSEMQHSLDAECMTLQIEVSRLTAKILTTVYGVGRNFDGSLIKNTQSILRDLAELLESLSDVLKTWFQGSVNKVSKTATRLVLSYHHCVVLTTRPLVMCLLQKRLTHSTTQTAEDLAASECVTALLHSCVDSALKVLRILRALGDDDILETFLPFQLEDTFSSAFLLYIIRAVSPGLIEDDSWTANAHEILDKMISRGNVAAPLRKLELKHLEQIMLSLSQTSPQAISLHVPLPPANEILRPETVASGLETPAVDNLVYDENLWDMLGINGAFTLSAHQLSCLADRLNVESIGGDL